MKKAVMGDARGREINFVCGQNCSQKSVNLDTTVLLTLNYHLIVSVISHPNDCQIKLCDLLGSFRELFSVGNIILAHIKNISLITKQ